jgi:CubicO group peptidase (beta-lactamase class C family)
MKNFYFNILCICFVSILFSCKTRQSTDPGAENSSHYYSDSYKPPVFTHDDRIEKIKKNAPELHKLIADYATAQNIPGISYGVVADNELVVSSSTGLINIERDIPANPSSCFRIASMTKSFTAMAIMKLRDEGKLVLSDPVSKFIPEMSNIEYLTKDAPTIDIENLLTMTAGFPEDNPWGDRQLDESEQMLIDLIGEGISFSNVPSYEYEYSNTGYALLGNIISRVSGIPFQKYITQNILQPLGMEQTYWELDSISEEQLAIGYRWEDEQWKLEPMLHDGSYGAMGGLITSIEDFSKYVSFLLSAWPPRSDEDTGPVKRSSLREMQTPQFSKLYANARDFKGDNCAIISGYGYGLRIAEYCSGLKTISHGGALPGFGSNYVFFPEYGIGIMAFCNLTYTSPYPFNEIVELLFENTKLKPRQLPVSDILLERQEQITKLIQNWDIDLEAKLLAENFYLDRSRDKRINEVQSVLEKAGSIKEISELEPENQLRGSFKIHAGNGIVSIFFTLTPEKYPKVQQLDISFKPNVTK